MTIPLTVLIARRDKKIEEMHAAQRAANEADPENGTMDEAAQAAFDEMKAALAKLEAAISNRAALDDSDRQTRGLQIGGGSRDDFLTVARDFNITRALAGACGLQVDDGAEREISRELQRRSGRTVEGIMIPLAALHRPVERRVLTPGGTGAGIVGVYLDETQYIDALRAALVVARLGARYLTGLDTNIDLPRLSATATASWVADGSGIPTDTTEAFNKISLRPHLLGGIVEFTRNMLITSTPAVQDAARNDLVQVLARGIDAAVLAGTGVLDPLGILNQPGLTIVSGGTNGAGVSWAGVLALMEAVQLANAPDANMGFVGNPRVRAQAMNTLRFAGVAAGTVMEDPEKLAGYPFASTTLCPANGVKGTGTGLSTLIFGAWSEVLVGIWGEGVEILVNPYGSPQFSAGNVQVRALINADVQIRHIGSFAALTDIAAP